MDRHTSRGILKPPADTALEEAKIEHTDTFVVQSRKTPDMLVATIFSAASFGLTTRLWRRQCTLRKAVPIEGIVFDLDGTLIDYEGASHEALERPLLKRGVKGFSWDLHSKIVGMRTEDWSRVVVESFQHEVHDLSASQYVDEYMEVMNDLYPRIKKWPGTLRVLRELKNRGFPMAIATSSPRYSFDKKMEFHPEILELMDAVVTGDEIQRGKPNPDIFLEAARRIQCNPANILVFEDSPFGIQGALEAGAHTVALPDPRLLQGTAEKFSKLSSTWTLDRIGEFDTSNIKRIDRRAKTSIFQTQQALAPSVEGISSPRDEIFKLTASVAKMASSLEHCHSCHVRNKESAYFDMLRQILRTAKSCQVDLGDACISKIEINKMKYPANLCRGKAGKYTAYTAATGIDKKTWQNSQGTAVMSKNISFEEVRDDVRDFVAARDWEKFHTPRNICLALIGELGELAELFQWKGDVQDPVFVGLSTFTSEESDKVKQELADVAVYAIRLGDLLGYSFDRI